MRVGHQWCCQVGLYNKRPLAALVHLTLGTHTSEWPASLARVGWGGVGQFGVHGCTAARARVLDQPLSDVCVSRPALQQCPVCMFLGTGCFKIFSGAYVSSSHALHLR